MNKFIQLDRNHKGKTMELNDFLLLPTARPSHYLQSLSLASLFLRTGIFLSCEEHHDMRGVACSIVACNDACLKS